ncbi:MAG: glycerophosphodiester phosphodiesterase family protein, partial [Candidatus Poribacteria bacterium]|nr:glycerophosphodiester phosphodiesterase family protein [Candidatus Poribacteria bacterium]
MTTPIIIAHRGLNAHAPENTLAAYAAALDLRLGFEVDVRETADNELVLLHDTTLDRTTDGSGELNATPFDELRRFDAGAWFDPAFAGQRVPTLDDTLSLASERKNDQTLIALDFKPTREGVEHRVCEMLERYELIDRVIGFGIIYTEASMRRRFKVANPSFPTARWIRADNEWRDGLTDPDSDWLYLREI